MRILCFGTLLILLVAGGVFAQDEVVLEDGRRFEGVIQWRTEAHVALQTSFGLIEFKRSHVARVGESTKVAVDRGERRSQGIIDLAKRRQAAQAQARAQARASAASPAATRKGTTPREAAAPTPATAPAPDPVRAATAASPVLHAGRVGWAKMAGAGTVEGDIDLELPLWLKQRLGPFFPRQPQSMLLLSLLLFALVLFIVQVGCRFLDIDSFSFPRGVILAALVLLLLTAIYSLRATINTPLAGILAVLVSFLVLAAAVTAIFQEHAGKATVLVGFLLFFSGLSISCIMVGAAGVVALW